jgi:uncharacterized membrane protein required for colicin V production
MGSYAWVIDIVLCLFLAAIIWAVSSQGLWGAALKFVNVMLAGLVAFNFYEPIASLLDRYVEFMRSFSDFVCLVILFVFAFLALDLLTDRLGPTMVRFPGWLYHAGRFVFAVATAWYTVGMMLAIVETAPIHKQFLGYQWQNHALWGAGIDRYWLGFVQATTRDCLEWDKPPRVFDPYSDYIVRYHEHRGFGDPDPSMPGHGDSAAAAGTTSSGTGGGTTAPPAGAGGPAGSAPSRTPATPAGAAGVASPESF